MPVVDGEKAARMIKSTVNPSSNAPIVAVCSQSSAIDDATGTLFTATLSKPIVRRPLSLSPDQVEEHALTLEDVLLLQMKADLLGVLSHLGFRLEVKAPESRRGSGDNGRPASPAPAQASEARRESA